ncbi:hypothetical protein MMC25_006881 [Agyrium rufum]|nr:hypothetical protein [Agyrium rufum]
MSLQRTFPTPPAATVRTPTTVAKSSTTTTTIAPISNTKTLATSTAISTPSTPTSKVSASLPVNTPSPGNWRHPRFDEIARRQKSSTFNQDNANKVIWNSGALVSTFLLINNSVPSYATYSSLWAIRLILAFNILNALLPLISPRVTGTDLLQDIPLTPTQRSLLGLDPSTPYYSSSPATPGSNNYITPPRYQRSATPQSGDARGASPLGTSPRNSTSRPQAYSPSSASASPLSRKASAQNSGTPTSHLWQISRGLGAGSTMGETARRHSSTGALTLGKRDIFGAAGASNINPKELKEMSVLGTSILDGAGRTSPNIGTGRIGNPSVPVNNKWLYEKGRNISGRFA